MSVCSCRAVGQKLDRAALQKGLEQIGYHLAEVSGRRCLDLPCVFGPALCSARCPRFRAVERGGFICIQRDNSPGPLITVQSEVSELFGVVDVQQRGEVGRAELAAGLIDWKAFEVRCSLLGLLAVSVKGTAPLSGLQLLRCSVALRIQSPTLNILWPF